MIGRLSDWYDLSEVSLAIELQTEDCVVTSGGAVGDGQIDGRDINELSVESLEETEGSGSKTGLSARLCCR